MPSEELLSSCEDCSGIVQTYLVSPAGTTERVRCRTWADRTVCYHTIKKRISDMRREEYESEISPAEYDRLLQRADPEKNVIRKTRRILVYKGQSFELDIFDFWSDRALLELELANEEQIIELPPALGLIREVTADRRYTNAALARCVPNELI